MNRLTAVQTCLAHTKRKNYLEIGVSTGLCFSRIAADLKIAVDPQFKLSKSRRASAESLARETHYFETTSDAFFSARPAQLERGISVAFIDGLHTYQQVVKDVSNTLPYLDEDGVILLHDCNPESASIATPASSFDDFRSKNRWWNFSWCGDVWKTVALLRSTRPDLQVAVLDCDYGVGVVRRGSASTQLNLRPDDIDRMSYADLARDRKHILNLQPPTQLQQLLA